MSEQGQQGGNDQGQQGQQGGNPASWFDTFDADTKAHMANRGWDKLNANTAAEQAIRAHREAEKYMGVPADQLLRKPKDASDQENWGRIREYIGVPKDAKDYDFAGVKFADGTELDAATADRLRAIAHKNHASKEDAVGIAKDFVAFLESEESAETAAYEAKLAEEKATLAKNWGANAQVNKIAAEGAAAKLGLKPETVAALEKTIGYAAVMEMFAKIGRGMGEDRYVGGGNGGDRGGAMSVDQAKARLDELKRDTDWQTKFDRGDREANKEWNDLTRIVAGV